ncbi:MAG: DUF1501 domain-containing protein, partial [Phycisphaerae bacterium]
MLTSLDQFRAAADSKDALDGMDSLTRQAMGVLTSRKLSEALDLSREYPAVLARYGVPKEATPVHGGGKLLE